MQYRRMTNYFSKMDTIFYLLFLCGYGLSITCLPTTEQGRFEQVQRQPAKIPKSYGKKSFQQVEETIDEVQKILANDPSLPRLTRGEIEELYEKVTREQYVQNLEETDVSRAESMRALMLVLPFNTDNNTEENLQELYTRPPVTKVVDTYTSHEPIKFVTAAQQSLHRIEKQPEANMPATTYKPSFNIQVSNGPSPTTYHPPAPLIKQQDTQIDFQTSFEPISGLKMTYKHNHNLSNNKEGKPKRYSSHYNAKDIDFLTKKLTTSTVKPVADVLENFGIVGNSLSRHRFSQPDIYSVAESAPQPVVSSYVPIGLNAEGLQGFRGESDLLPKIRPDAYTNFKPLNIGEELRVKPEIESYLTRFGIVGGRKRKVLAKPAVKGVKSFSVEQISEESEIATAKVPNNNLKSAPTATKNTESSSELLKLLENLQELERLNLQYKQIKKSTTKPKPTTSSTTTTTSPSIATKKVEEPFAPLVTHGSPLIIEPKKPRRRIDPNIDINFANLGNQQRVESSADQLTKLLENLKELEKLQSNVDPKKQKDSSQQLINTASGFKNAQSLINRFSDNTESIMQAPQDVESLDNILKELQKFEKLKDYTTSSTTTQKSLTTVLAANDLLQLRKLLSNERELEQLYEKARKNLSNATPVSSTLTRPATKPKNNLLNTTPNGGFTYDEFEQLQKYVYSSQDTKIKSIPSTTSTSTTTPAAITTPAPSFSSQEIFNFSDIELLQKYLMTMNSKKTSGLATTSLTTSSSTAAPSTTTPSTTTSSTTTPSTTTVSTTISTKSASIEVPSKMKKIGVDQMQLEDLIKRIQDLERRNSELSIKTSTESPMPFLGFTTRNVNMEKSIRNPDFATNDFAHLQDLYSKVRQAEKNSFGSVEISTARTANIQEISQKKTQNFAERFIDITNDTGSGSSLHEVDPEDFVQLQKLLKKVQELERVKIQTSTESSNRQTNKIPSKATPTLVTSASIQSPSVSSVTGAHIVYPENSKTFSNIADIIKITEKVDGLQLDLPIVPVTSKDNLLPLKNSSKKRAGVSADFSSSEELHELAYSIPANPVNSKIDKNESKYHAFISSLEVDKKLPYEHMKPIFLQEYETSEPPLQQVKTEKHKTAELKELQKLLNNAQELEKLGIKLPNEFSQQIENKLASTNMDKQTKQNNSNQLKVIMPTTPASLYEDHEPSERTAVFSLTTQKTSIPKEPKAVTENSAQLPIFSATKIIEDAIKRAASKIGVSTETIPSFVDGFRKRMDNEDDWTIREDLMGDFSDINYQLAVPDGFRTQRSSETQKQGLSNGHELQRLIANLEELQKLNINLTPAQVQEADSKYLETLKKQLSETEESKKNRRQSSNLTTMSSASPIIDDSKSPLHLNLNSGLSLSDLDVVGMDDISKSVETTQKSPTSTTTEESRNGSLADLENSFGPDPVAESPPPPKKKNGFYFLADWNSFLEVGDGDDQVVVRFSPKIGDPRLFLPVKIP